MQSYEEIDAKLAEPDPSSGKPSSVLTQSGTPPALERAVLRLGFPPSYVVVGAYRLVTDRSLFVPIWQKCKHGIVRGAAVGLAWAVLSFNIQRGFVRLFMNSPRVIGMSDDTLLGIKLPFDIPTYATIGFLLTQATAILTFFLARNLRVARARVWDQTVASRGKGPEFWGAYVEEWDVPPTVDVRSWAGLDGAKGWALAFVVKRVVLLPLHVVPFMGLVVSAWFRAYDTARYLHRPYFEAKKMTREQIAVFVAEHKWDYRLFGFAAALLESVPLLGLLFSVSNRIGAAMWAHDLEKRQHFVAAQKARKAA